MGAAHKLNFPQTVAINRSVAELTGLKLREGARMGKREVHVIFGGAPCKSFPLLGKRAWDAELKPPTPAKRSVLIGRVIFPVLSLRDSRVYFVPNNLSPASPNPGTM